MLVEDFLTSIVPAPSSRLLVCNQIAQEACDASHHSRSTTTLCVNLCVAVVKAATVIVVRSRCYHVTVRKGRVIGQSRDECVTPTHDAVCVSVRVTVFQLRPLLPPRGFCRSGSPFPPQNKQNKRDDHPLPACLCWRSQAWCVVCLASVRTGGSRRRLSQNHRMHRSSAL